MPEEASSYSSYAFHPLFEWLLFPMTLASPFPCFVHIELACSCFERGVMWGHLNSWFSDAQADAHLRCLQKLHRQISER